MNFFTKLLPTIFADTSIQACYLFGSQVKGKANPESDYDIAVFVDNKNTINPKTVLEPIIQAFLYPERLHISIVDLENTSPAFLMQIVKKGELLYEKPEGYHIPLESLIMRMHFDDQYRTDIYYQALKQKYANR